MSKVVGFVIVNDRNEFLLQLRDDDPRIPYPNHWVFPGGGIEGNEEPIQAVVREVGEEFGIVLNVSELRLLGSYDRDDDVHCDIFIVHLHGKINLLVREGRAAKFFSREELASMRLGFEQERHLLPLLSCC